MRRPHDRLSFQPSRPSAPRPNSPGYGPPRKRASQLGGCLSRSATPSRLATGGSSSAAPLGESPDFSVPRRSANARRRTHSNPAPPARKLERELCCRSNVGVVKRQPVLASQKPYSLLLFLLAIPAFRTPHTERAVQAGIAGRHGSSSAVSEIQSPAFTGLLPRG